MSLDSNEFQMTTVIKVVGGISSSYSWSENGELKRTFEVHCDFVSLYVGNVCAKLSRAEGGASKYAEALW
jgi:hypothetical protein